MARSARLAWLRSVVIPLRRFAGLEGQDVGLEPGTLLLGESVVFRRKQTLVEYVRDHTDPALVEMMEDSRINARPVMDWHEHPLGFRSGSVNHTPPSL